MRIAAIVLLGLASCSAEQSRACRWAGYGVDDLNKVVRACGFEARIFPDRCEEAVDSCTEHEWAVIESAWECIASGMGTRSLSACESREDKAVMDETKATIFDCGRESASISEKCLRAANASWACWFDDVNRDASGSRICLWPMK